jgi:hypothetical protein
MRRKLVAAGVVLLVLILSAIKIVSVVKHNNLAKKNPSQSTSTKVGDATKEIFDNMAQKVAQPDYKYSDKDASAIIALAQSYVAKGDNKAAIELIQNVPDTAKFNVVFYKYDLLLIAYKNDKDQSKFEATKTTFKALLNANRKDNLAKTALLNFDQTYTFATPKPSLIKDGKR